MWCGDSSSSWEGLSDLTSRESVYCCLQVYVKDVFPNSGRFSVTMDPDITKDKVSRVGRHSIRKLALLMRIARRDIAPQVVAARQSRRSAVKRRTRNKRMEETHIGTEKRATVIKVRGPLSRHSTRTAALYWYLYHPCPPISAPPPVPLVDV